MLLFLITNFLQLSPNQRFCRPPFSFQCRSHVCFSLFSCHSLFVLSLLLTCSSSKTSVSSFLVLPSEWCFAILFVKLGNICWCLFIYPVPLPVHLDSHLSPILPQFINPLVPVFPLVYSVVSRTLIVILLTFILTTCQANLTPRDWFLLRFSSCSGTVRPRSSLPSFIYVSFVLKSSSGFFSPLPLIVTLPRVFLLVVSTTYSSAWPTHELMRSFYCIYFLNFLNMIKLTVTN